MTHEAYKPVSQYILEYLATRGGAGATVRDVVELYPTLACTGTAADPDVDYAKKANWAKTHLLRLKSRGQAESRSEARPCGDPGRGPYRVWRA
ncbi:MAG: hypothetical protein EBZ59_11310, partial [Planctomycetia bacterium]|nr:hypothetical protein [Planctomycetia bacterium]